MFRTALLITAALVLAGCASRGTQDCEAIAGPAWSRLSADPTDSRELLIRANLPDNAEVLWFGQGKDQVMVCDPSNSLVNPGCGGSTAYQFERKAGAWVSRGVLLPVCD
ncbi:hypothetical protein [Nevskia sp.]|uniref:hypothetical protein n=1 Tax=Nevskia sp. TaxID=1929292 RepID=UPI0025F74F0C|nr:hypothetical protein [Nevskia sp.]